MHIDVVGEGRPLVLLHGWAMHSGLFAPIAPRLSERYCLLLVDLPGHGRSEPLTPYTLDALANAVADAVDEIVGEVPLNVLGWSFGGSIALHWAGRAPERVSRLILVAATPCFTKRSDWEHAMSPTTLRQFADELSVSYRLTLQRFISLQVQGSDRPRQVLAELRSQLFARGEPSRETLRDALILLERVDLRGEIGAVRQAATIIAGEHDTLVPPIASEWLARALPRATFRSIPGAGHAPFLSHPDAFLEALADDNR